MAYEQLVSVPGSAPNNYVPTSDGQGGYSWAPQQGGGSGGGADGVGIQSVEQTTTSTEDSGINVVTVTMTDGTTSTFDVRNGSKGSTGKTAYQYAQDGGYTGTEAEFATKLAEEMPTTQNREIIDVTLTEEVATFSVTEDANNLPFSEIDFEKETLCIEVNLTTVIEEDKYFRIQMRASFGGNGRDNLSQLKGSLSTEYLYTYRAWVKRIAGVLWYAEGLWRYSGNDAYCSAQTTPTCASEKAYQVDKTFSGFTFAMCNTSYSNYSIPAGTRIHIYTQ